MAGANHGSAATFEIRDSADGSVRDTYLKFDLSSVTDVGLKELARLKTLPLLSLKGTGVSDTGVKEFEKSLPKCIVFK